MECYRMCILGFYNSTIAYPSLVSMRTRFVGVILSSSKCLFDLRIKCITEYNIIQ